jgi:HEAT repeat protein
MKRLIAAMLACSMILGAVPAAHAQRRPVPEFLGQDLFYWQSRLDHKDPAVRRSAAFAVGQIGSQALSAVPLLLRHLEKDPDAGVRESAAAALGDVVASLRLGHQVLDKDCLEVLRVALDTDANARVQRSAAYAIGTFGRSALPAVGSLKKALANPSAAVRQNAAWALGQVGSDAGEDAVTALLAVLADKDALVRRDAAGALGEIGEPVAAGATPDLLKMLDEEPDEVVRKTALGSLARLAGPKYAKTPTKGLERLLDDKDPETQLGAAQVLASMGGAKAALALPGLRKALKEGDPHIQGLAAGALAALGSDAAPAVEDLALALKDSPDPETRRNAAVALGGIGIAARPAVPALTAALELKNPVQVREFAAVALAQIIKAFYDAGLPYLDEVVPAALQAIQNDTNQHVRHHCVYALFPYPGFARDTKATEVVGKLLDETAMMEPSDMHYAAARLLALRLGPRAPQRTVEVLMHMLLNKEIRIFNKIDARVQAGNEASAGRSDVAPNLGSDARFMAAESLGQLGELVKKRKDVVDALKDAARDPEPKLKDAARKALANLGVN